MSTKSFVCLPDCVEQVRMLLTRWQFTATNTIDESVKASKSNGPRHARFRKSETVKFRTIIEQHVNKKTVLRSQDLFMLLTYYPNFLFNYNGTAVIHATWLSFTVLRERLSVQLHYRPGSALDVCTWSRSTRYSVTAIRNVGINTINLFYIHTCEGITVS